MNEPVCAVEVGIHTGPYWQDRNIKTKRFVVCNRHMIQYNERKDEFTPFDWVQIPVCIGCGTYDSLRWSKCCDDHTPAIDPDVVCDGCRYKLHAPKVPTTFSKGSL